MRRKEFYAAFATCTILGLAAAIYGWRTRSAAESPRVLRVLCAETWLDDGALAEFGRAHGVRVELFTYRRVDEFLRQLANADGRVDVMCTSSLLVRSLARAGWIKRTAWERTAVAREVAADFTHLPYDPGFTLGLPLYWWSYGILSPRPFTGKWSEAAARGRAAVWGTTLNAMALMTSAGVNFADRLESEDVRGLQNEVQRFASAFTLIAPDAALADPAQWLKRFDAAHVPQATVPAGLGFFQPGEDGGIVDVGLLAIGERAPNPDLARDLVERLAEPRVAVTKATALGLGTTLARGEGEASLKPAQRPSALRAMPLTRLRFPDVDSEAALKFSGTFEKVR